MRPSSVIRPLLVLLLLAAPVSAGTLYVPLVAPDEPEGATYQTRIWLTNRGKDPATVVTVRLSDLVDGTRERGEPRRETVAAGATVVLAAGGGSGMLEVRAPAQVAVNAELRNTTLPGPREVFGSVPIVWSGNAAKAGAEVVLQGIRRTTTGVRSHLGLVNLGHAQARCEVEARGADGHALGKVDEVPLPPLSHVLIEDVLDLLGLQQVGDVHAAITCNRQFYAYLAVIERATGELVFLEPSPTGASSLKPPGAGDEAPPPGAGSGSDGKSHVFALGGTFHQPSPGKPTFVTNIQAPPNRAYRRVVLEMDVTPGPWYRRQPDKMHNLFWLHRGGCCWPTWKENVIGFANAFGPGSGGGAVKVSHNLGVPRRPYPRLAKGFELQQGKTYRVRYEYDGAGGRVTLRLSSGGKVLFTVTDRARVSRIRSPGSGQFMAYFGHKNSDGTGHGPERPTYGWKYANLRVELIE